MSQSDIPREPGSVLIQVVQRTGKIERVRRGEVPVVELFLFDHQRIVSIELREAMFESRTRKTKDWYWTAYVESRHPVQAGEP
jgi:hypothetical protein